MKSDSPAGTGVPAVPSPAGPETRLEPYLEIDLKHVVLRQALAGRYAGPQRERRGRAAMIVVSDVAIINTWP